MAVWVARLGERRLSSVRLFGEFEFDQGSVEVQNGVKIAGLEKGLRNGWVTWGADGSSGEVVEVLCIELCK